MTFDSYNLTLAAAAAGSVAQRVVTAKYRRQGVFLKKPFERRIFVKAHDKSSRFYKNSEPVVEAPEGLLDKFIKYTFGGNWGLASTSFAVAGLATCIVNIGVFLFYGDSKALGIQDLGQIASFRGMPTIEENLKEGFKKIEAGVDNVIDIFDQSQETIVKTELVQDLKRYQEFIYEVWEVIDTNYLDVRSTGFDKKNWASLRDEMLQKKPATHAAALRAAKEMIARGLSDPYTRIIPQDEFASMRKYDMTGVGMNVGSAEEYIKKTSNPLPVSTSGGIWVLGLLKGSASDKAGLHQGDQILEIDGKPVGGASSFQAASLIKGRADSNSKQEQVTLKVRNLEGNIFNVSMTRQAVSVPSPMKSRIEKVGKRRIGYLELSSFNSRAQEEMISSIKELERQKATELVIDLRGNRGGLVQEGIEIAKAFLNQNSTVLITQESGDRGETAIFSGSPPLTMLPLTVLVDSSTASASEILAGALKDNCRAVLAGERTFGKGLIQSVYALSDGTGLVLTVGKYLTPAKIDIDREGIYPDFRNIPTLESAKETIKACKVRRGLD